MHLDNARSVEKTLSMDDGYKQMGNGTVAYKHNADLRRQHNNMKRRNRREDNCRMHGNVNGREDNCRMHDGTTSGTRGVNRMHCNACGMIYSIDKYSAKHRCNVRELDGESTQVKRTNCRMHDGTMR